MNKILINIHQKKKQSVVTVSNGFIEFPEGMFPSFWLNNKQFTVNNSELEKYVQLFVEQKSRIFFRFKKEEQWIPYITEEFIWDDVNHFLSVRMVGIPYKPVIHKHQNTRFLLNF